MRKTIRLVCLASGCAGALSGQVSPLAGKYFARHVEYLTDANNNVADARSIVGTMTFDGTGTYTFSGQQLILTGAPAPYSVSGTCSVSGADVVAMTNPQTTTGSLNARYGSEAVIGVSTNGTGGLFDLFVAIPAPAATVADSNATLGVSWALVDYELTGASSSQVRDSGVTVQFDGKGNIPTVGATGHGASIAGGATQKQQYTGAYALNSDGSGTISFTPPAGLPASNALLAQGSRVLGVSASASMAVRIPVVRISLQSRWECRSRR